MYIFLLFIFLLPIFGEESHFDLNINELQEVIITENDYGSFIKSGFKVYSTENPSKDFNLLVESKSLKEEIYKENGWEFDMNLHGHKEAGKKVIDKLLEKISLSKF